MGDVEHLLERVGTLLEATPSGDAVAASPGAGVSLRDDMRRAREAAIQAPTSQGSGGAAARDEWLRIRTDIERSLPAPRPRLELAAWWTEASVQLDGFAGLAAGLSLIANMLKTRWDDLEPKPAPDEITGDAQKDARLLVRALFETLATPLASHLPGAVRRVPLFRLDEGVPYTYAGHLHGKQRDAILKSLAEIKAGGPSQDDFARNKAVRDAKEAELALPEMQPWPEIVAAAAGQAEEIAAQRAALAKAGEALAALKAEIEARNGFSVAPTTVLAALLGEIAGVVDQLIPSMPAGDSAVAGDPAAGTGGKAQAASVMNRERAFAQLAEVADFFRRTEPQSPIADVLEELGRRARLSWSELVAEILPEAGQREAMRERLGLPRQRPGG